MISRRFLTEPYLHGTFNPSSEVDDVDPFADIEEDEKELEENEVHVVLVDD